MKLHLTEAKVDPVSFAIQEDDELLTAGNTHRQEGGAVEMSWVENFGSSDLYDYTTECKKLITREGREAEQPVWGQVSLNQR